MLEFFSNSLLSGFWLSSGMGKGIIDAAKLFKKMKSPPVYSFSSAPGVNAVDGSVPQDAEGCCEWGADASGRRGAE